MKYRVSINYYHFIFDTLSDACTFATLAESHGEKDNTVCIEFIHEEENTDNE